CRRNGLYPVCWGLPENLPIICLASDGQTNRLVTLWGKFPRSRFPRGVPRPAEFRLARQQRRESWMNRSLIRPASVPALAALALSALAATAASAAPAQPGQPATTTPIKHVVVIIGENHTFDNVFATYQPPRGQHIRNLLSEGIVTKNGTLGPNYARAS